MADDREDKVESVKFEPSPLVMENLPEEQIQEILEKQWIPREKQFKQLTGPKTIEGKRKALANLTTKKKLKLSETPESGGHVKKLLTRDEQKYYDMRRAKYLADFELNDSSDEILLEQVLWLEIMIYRLMEEKSKKKNADVEKQIEKLNSTLRATLANLGMLREQRLKQHEEVTQTIADLVVQFDKERWLHKLAEYEKEEREELRRKKERDDTVDTNDMRSIEEFIEGLDNYGDSEGNSN